MSGTTQEDGGGQMTLAGMEAPAATDRLFFALFPDASAAARIATLARDARHAHGLHGKPLRSERFHVTLHHLGDHAGLPDALVAQAQQAAAGVDLPPFEAGFDAIGSFSGRRQRPLVLRGGEGLSALRSFQQALGRRMQAAGLARWVEHRFEPHVTLLYDEWTVPAQPVTPVAWRVDSFALVHSLLGRTEYRVLGQWPLV